MIASRGPFLVTGFGFIALGFATAVLGLLLIGPALAAACAGQISPIQLVSIAMLGLITTLFTVFYVIMGVAILKRRWRTFVIVGASISCILVPFGTVLGLLFLLWTRPEWPVSASVHQS